MAKDSDRKENKPSLLRRVSARLLSQPVFRLILAGFVIVALVPLSIVSVQTYKTAWDNAWREITEKHRLLALNLAAPISIYIDDHFDVLRHLAAEIERAEVRPDFDPVQFVNGAFASLRGFRSLGLAKQNGLSDAVTHRKIPDLKRIDFSAEVCFLRTRDSLKPDISQLKPSILDGKPTIVLTEPVLRPDGALIGVLIAELKLGVIEQLRKKIAFGEKGHSAIVDAHGKVLAHPNAGWMAEMRDLSHLPIVKNMMQGETGVTEFYSPFVKQQMVAGYTSVPKVGWGIMVPQPKREIEAQVHALLLSHFQWAGLGILLALGIAIQITRWITRPLNRFSAAAEALTKQNFEGELPVIADASPKEVRQLGTAFHQLVTGLQRSRDKLGELSRTLKTRVEESTQELVKANRQLEVLARADHLTDLFNRRHFEAELARLIEDTRANGGQHVLLYVDLDRFKLINDNYGHEAGDELLRQYADLLRANVRHGSDTVARIGGDEFAILLKGCPYDEAIRIAKKLRADVANMQFRWEQDVFRLTVCVGMVAIDANVESISDVMRLADRSCQAAKMMGRNQIYPVEQEKTTQMQDRPSRWLGKLSEALMASDFALYSQPMVLVGNNKVGPSTNYEVLLRYRDKDGSIATPESFLPTAERFNLMPQIDRWVTQSVFDWFSKNLVFKECDSLLFINLSAQSLNDKEFSEFLLKQIDDCGLPADRFCFEITETEVLTSLNLTKAFMLELKTIGCKFALDDFGTGMSSFTHIRELPIDVLKIDGVFVSNMQSSGVDAEIVRSMVDIAHALGFLTVAESVEDEQTMRHVTEIGVDYVQGNVIGHPQPLDSIGDNDVAEAKATGLT